MRILKFGGTSVGSAEAFDQVAKIVARARQQDSQVVVVTSAMSGVTDTLINAAKAAAAGDRKPYREAREDLMAKHQMVAGQLIGDGVERAALGRLFDARLTAFERLCRSVDVLGELTPRGLDVISGTGERLSAPLLAAVLRANGVAAEWVDAAEIVVTDDNFGNADPLIEPTTVHVESRLQPLLNGGVVPVITGFIGATKDGISTTLGRGGSDYSAAILGAALHADEVQIWTDVNGIMTADPRVVPTARTIPEISYIEAAELAFYGAKVLHPKTILPAVERDIPILVLNTFEPDHCGYAGREGAEAQQGRRQGHHGDQRPDHDHRGRPWHARRSGYCRPHLYGGGAGRRQRVDDQPVVVGAEHQLRDPRGGPGCCYRPAARRDGAGDGAPSYRSGAATRRDRDRGGGRCGHEGHPRRLSAHFRCARRGKHQRHRHRAGQQRMQHLAGRGPRRRGRRGAANSRRVQARRVQRGLATSAFPKQISVLWHFAGASIR